ncbi:hypothetical protein EDD37DRAFT_648014 [Exophiala viscosa]|uniref:uncharacterized protein n=1 Tax=Exophiala viscosa TaxID=2486360 RepID=UPI002196E1F3|nr:hypothetical protein EDD37DRAFT_648014 [Exophiala viscosa]
MAEQESGIIWPMMYSSLKASYAPDDFAYQTVTKALSERDKQFRVPYHQRPQKDLSGTQQQLHIRSWSTKSLTEPDSLKLLPPPVHSPRLGGLIKSKTTNDLLASPRDITPRRRLLQPIGPPVPRTQTLSNISCFGPTSLTPSPRKPSSVIASQAYGYYDDMSQLSVGDALGESRMTEKEMEVLKQVQREAATNRIRLRNAHSLPPAAPAPTSKGKTSAPTTLIKNTAIPRSLGRLQRKSASGRPLFIDSALANKATIESSSPSPRALTTTIDSSPGSSPEDILKHVYFAESLQYWTGRYVSSCDRIRNQEMQHAKPLTPKDANNERLDQLFESEERLRMYAALKELRQYCKTTIALGSFEDFEAGLLGNSGNTRGGHRRRASQIVERVPEHEETKATGSGGIRPLLSWGLSQSPGNTSTPTSWTSSVNAEAVMSSSSDAFYGLGSLPKSKTTGNLASLIPITVKKQTARADNSSAKPGTTEPTTHRRRTSYLDCSPELRAKVLKDREERAARRAAEAHRRSSSRLPSQGAGTGGDQSQTRSQSSKPSARLRLEQYQVTDSKIGNVDNVMSPLDCAMLDTGHGVPPSISSGGSLTSPQVQVVNVSGGGVEKLIKSRRKTERQSGGEMVKSLFGVGMREVRKMGRRVGSWAGSSDDLLSPGQN